jgi:hypothetical protein
MALLDRPLGMVQASPLARLLPFPTWWNMPIIKDSQDTHYSRADIVLLTVNRDGGAHIDDLTPAQLALKQGTFFGWVRSQGSLRLEPVPPTLRTMATELDLMFSEQGRLLGLPGWEPFVSPDK